MDDQLTFNLQPGMVWIGVECSIIVTILWIQPLHWLIIHGGCERIELKVGLEWLWWLSFVLENLRFLIIPLLLVSGVAVDQKSLILMEAPFKWINPCRSRTKYERYPSLGRRSRINLLTAMFRILWGSCLGTVMEVYRNTTIQTVLELVQICVLFDGSESIQRILGRDEWFDMR